MRHVYSPSECVSSSPSLNVSNSSRLNSRPEFSKATMPNVPKSLEEKRTPKLHQEQSKKNKEIFKNAFGIPLNFLKKGLSGGMSNVDVNGTLAPFIPPDRLVRLIFIFQWSSLSHNQCYCRKMMRKKKWKRIEYLVEFPHCLCQMFLGLKVALESQQHLSTLCLRLR